MALSPGARLGPYEILSPLGAGGMGEVYRARDTRLGREVAVKVLPQRFSSSAEVRQRFEREARTISQLSHPHVCALYDVGREGDIEYLVMEYLEGETLSERLARGPLSQDQTLRYGQEIADALDRAHRQGIAHRDLKPANVMLTKSGVKLLDFGLAKAMAPPAPAASVTALPTQQGLTQEGTILGTFQYMAPEQLEGKEADARTDIFALGATLYEMATGKKAFSGTSQASLISSIMTAQPPPISKAQPLSPPALDRVVQTCLAKDPEERWQSAADVKRELKWVAEASPTAGAVARVAPPTWRSRLPWVVAGVLGVALIGLALAGRPSSRTARPSPIHAYLLPPEKTAFTLTGDDGAPVAVSPDGTRVAFGAGGSLWVESLDTGTATAVFSGRGRFPFWSPDSRSIGFFADGKLKIVEASGGSVRDVCEAVNPRGGAWSPEGVLVFAPDIRGSLLRVPVSGGPPAPLTRLAASHTTHRWPEFLPDGRHLIYLAANHNEPRSSETGIYLSSLDGKESRRLVQTVGSAQWVPGFLLFLRDTSLIAQPFDERNLALAGEPLRVEDQVYFDEGIWRGAFSASRTGVLAYQIASRQQGGQLTWFDRAGRPLGAVAERGRGRWPDISPDGSRVAVLLGDPNDDVYVYEVGRGTRIRLTNDASVSGPAIWSPDGSQLAYSVQLASPTRFRFVLLPSSYASGARNLVTSTERDELTDWSRDGRYLLFNRGNLGATDIWALPLAEPEKAFPIARTQWLEGNGQFSPDGHWVAYQSLDSGRSEIYVTPFPAGGARWQISTNGGQLVRWRGDGGELYFLSLDNELMAASVGGSAERFEVRRIETLFRVRTPPVGRTDEYVYDVTADGQRFLFNAAGDSESPRVALVTNWTAGMKK